VQAVYQTAYVKRDFGGKVHLRHFSVFCAGGKVLGLVCRIAFSLFLKYGKRVITVQFPVEARDFVFIATSKSVQVVFHSAFSPLVTGEFFRESGQS
jgi:hypothetical protein